MLLCVNPAVQGKMGKRVSCFFPETKQNAEITIKLGDSVRPMQCCPYAQFIVVFNVQCDFSYVQRDKMYQGMR